MRDKHHITEERNEGKLSRSVLETSGAGDSLAEFNTSTSVGDSWSGQQITKIRDHYAKLRAVLQQKAAKGTRSSRRRCRQLLARLSGKEKRFQSWVNHNISRRLVDKAASNGMVIALEDLTGIRERTNQEPRPKIERRRSNSWAFFQLRQFLTYKCVVKGVKLILVNPAYTSQTCHKCLHVHPVKGKSYRNGKTFRCGHCNWKCDADYNGAKNIAALGSSVNRPGGNGLFCKVTEKIEYIQLTLWDWLRATESSHHTT
jgi:putative transposase